MFIKTIAAIFTLCLLTIPTLAQEPAGAGVAEVQKTISDLSRIGGHWVTYFGNAGAVHGNPKSEDPEEMRKQAIVEAVKLANNSCISGVSGDGGQVRYLSAIHSYTWCVDPYGSNRITSGPTKFMCYAKAIVNCTKQPYGGTPVR
jgi:hypothetical protein